MLISTEDLDWRSGLDHANRAFAAMVGGQRYENITREEAKRLCPPQLVHNEKPRRSRALFAARGLYHDILGLRDRLAPLFAQRLHRLARVPERQ